MKKGFTLIELLAVIAILAIIMIIATPRIMDTIENSKIRAYIQDEQMMVKATETYFGNNFNELPENVGDTVEITLTDLKNNQLIGNLSDQSGTCDGYILVTKTDEGFRYKPELKCGDSNTIGSSTDDKLVANYTFNDYLESTTNVVTNTNLDTGWSKGYQSDIVFDEIAPPVGINSPVVGFNNGTSSIDNGYWFSYGDYAPQEPGKTYTVSIYVKTLHPKFHIKFYTADNAETGRYWSSVIHVPNDGLWHRIEWPAFTNAADSQSDSLSFHFYYYNQTTPTDPNTRTWFCAPQMEAKDHATPFVEGTRNVSIKDYSLNTNDLTTELAYEPIWNEEEKNGYYNFDGSSTYVELKDELLSTADVRTNGLTISLWAKPEALNQQRLVCLQTGNGYSDCSTGGIGIDAEGHARMIAYSDANPSGYQYANSDTILTTDTWYHLVGTYEPSDHKIKIYVNGKLGGTPIVIGDYSRLITNISNMIGKHDHYTSDQYYYDGSMDEIKIYNRPLSAEEIKYQYDTKKAIYE